MSVLVLVAALVVTATALYQIAGRLRLLGYEMMEFAAKHSYARNGNILLAVALWLLWFYLK